MITLIAQAAVPAALTERFAQDTAKSKKKHNTKEPGAIASGSGFFNFYLALWLRHEDERS